MGRGEIVAHGRSSHLEKGVKGPFGLRGEFGQFLIDFKPPNG